MGIHRIRLREPWECETRRDGVCWRRRFNRPTGLGSRERVSLVVERLAGNGEVRLNGALLGRLEPADAAARFDVTDRLEPHNEVMLLVSIPKQIPTGLPAEVALEIVD